MIPDVTVDARTSTSLMIVRVLSAIAILEVINSWETAKSRPCRSHKVGISRREIRHYEVGSNVSQSSYAPHLG